MWIKTFQIMKQMYVLLFGHDNIKATNNNLFVDLVISDLGYRPRYHDLIPTQS